MAQHQIFSRPKCSRGRCEDCDAQYLSDEVQQDVQYKESLTDGQAQAVINKLLKNTLETWISLDELLRTHGDVILSRWCKKSKEKRESLLRETAMFSTVPQDHPSLPFAEDFGYMWSAAGWMNLKSFVEDRMRFLSLLHARVANTLADYAVLDCRESFDYNPIYYNANCVSICGRDYGALEKWDEQKSHSWAIVGFPRACTMISVQSRIMAFLRQAVTLIIKDAEPTGDRKWLSAVNDGFKGSGRAARWSSYTSPAFADPVHFDPRLLYQKARARLDMLLDDLEFLQTDPASMHFEVSQRKANAVCGSDEYAPPEVRWRYLAQGFVLDFMGRLDAWQQIIGACANLCDALEMHPHQSSSGESLHPAVSTSLVELKIKILKAMDMRLTWFQISLPDFAAFRGHHRVLDESLLPVQAFVDLDPSNQQDRILKHVRDIVRFAEKRPYHSGLSLYFELLERELLLQESKGGRIDERLLDHLSDFAAMDEIFSFCVFNQIGHADNIFQVSDVPMPPIAPDWPFKDWPTGQRFMKIVQWLEDANWMQPLKCLQAFEEAPFPKGRKNLAYLEKSKECRKRLAAFWQEFRKVSIKYHQIAGEDYDDHSLDLVRFDTDPQYLEICEQERVECEEGQKLLDAKAASAKLRPQIEPQQVWGADDGPMRPVRRQQTKAKATKMQDAACTDDEDAVPSLITSRSDNESAPDESPILVKQATLDLVTKMLSADSATSGKVQWVALVQALTDAGLVASESAGSAVSFCNETNRIVIHKPHPEPVVQGVRLQKIGKRLVKRFNWHIERFQLRQKLS